MRIFFITFFAGIMIFAARAESNRFLTSGISRARSFAMGSAYHSLVDDFSAGLYNPGAFKLNSTREEHSYRFFFNPVAAVTAFYEYSKYNRDYEKDDKLTMTEGLAAASLLIKGAVMTTHYVDIGCNLGEEIIMSDSLFSRKGCFFSDEGLTNGSFNSAFVSVKIDPSISLGISGTLYKSRTSGKSTYKGGYALGILLNPNPKLSVGIVYNEIPREFSRGRFNPESIEAETVTSGISYYLDENMVISVDLRNLNKEDKLATREIHTGFERRFFERIALRAGYYRKKMTQDDVYSFGIGILPAVNKISKYLNSTRNDLFSYTTIIEENGIKYNWHIFSLLIRY
jgi:hypothetical protein